jgi:hypothetical protein
MKTILSALLLCILFLQMPAQKLALEKTYAITGQAKRGYLDEAAYDAPTKTTKLTFITKESTNFTGNKSKVKYQEYYFDEKFDFIRMDEKVDEYRNKKYKGENYQVEGVSMANNLVGTFVLRRKLTTYTWDWFFGGYKKRVKLLEVVKPKDDAGKKYTLLRKFENDETGEVIAMVMAKGLKGVTPNEYVFLKVNPSFDFEVTDKLQFSSPQSIAYSGLLANIGAEQEEGELDEEESGDEGPEATEDQGDLSTSNAGFVFAPLFAGKKASGESNDYTFLRVSAQGKILSKVSVQAKASAWNITQGIDAGTSIFLMGPANEGKYLNQEMVGDLEKKKWKLFQICRITNDKVQYTTTTDLDEFEAKLKTPPSQKKSPSYRGKKFYFSDCDLNSDGSVLINGQNFVFERRAKVQVKSYRDVLMFYFDPNGVLKAQYGVRREENNKYAQMAPATQMITTGQLASYWTVMEMDGVRTEREGKFKSIKALLYPSVARIDLASGDIGDFVQFGTENGKPKYYLHNRIPTLPMSQENAIVYLGTNGSGKTLWFGKVVLE